MKGPTEHISHDPPGRLEIEAFLARNKIRTKAQNQPELTAGQVIRSERSALPDAISDRLPGTHSLKNSINRYRSKTIQGPANPQSLADLGIIPDEFKNIMTRGILRFLIFLT